MSYRKTYYRITLIAWSTIAAIFVLCFIAPHTAGANALFKARIDNSIDGVFSFDDLNGDGNQDMVSPPGYGGDGGVRVLLGNGDGTFQAAVNYSTGGNSVSVAIGDLNGDAKPDMAVVNGGGCGDPWDPDEFPCRGFVSVFLGNGDGTFQNAVNYDVGNWPGDLAIVDLNGDNNPDFVLKYVDAVAVLLGNGDGTFQSAVNYSAGDDPGSVAIGDLNGDDDPDLAVANRNSNNVSVLLGNGDGTFQGAVNYAVGDGPFYIAIVGLNGDGNPDLVVANYNSDNVSVLLGNGDGTFQSAVNFAVGDGPSSVAIGKLDGDSDLDLVVANYESDNFSVLLGKGDGTFQGAVNYAVGVRPFYNTLVDLNGDSDLDLVVATDDSDDETGLTGNDYVSVLLGKGDGTFQAAVQYSRNSLHSSITLVDLMGDANLDLVIATNYYGGIPSVPAWVSVFPGNGDGTFGVANYSAGGGSVAIGDLNGDANLDVVTSSVSVLLGNGDGTLQGAVNYAAGDGPRSVAIGDLNGDGDPDLAVANRDSDNVSVLLGNGDGTFQGAVNYAVGDGPISVAIGDLDEDGDLDLAVANGGSNNVSVLLGNGAGTFRSAVNYAAGDEPHSVAIGDLNGDDDPDLSVANYNGGNVSVLLGNGDGSFQAAVNYGVNGSAHSIAIGDLNGDGAPDLAVTGGWPLGVSVLFGNGDGTFQDADKVGGGEFVNSVAIDDLDGDGNQDLVATENYLDIAYVLLGNGDGTFQSGGIYGAANGAGSLAIDDLDGDGALDLAVMSGGGVSILINTGPATTVNLLYTPVTPCRIADTRKSGGIIGANTQRNFHVSGNGDTISAQGGNPAGCPAPMGEPLAAHINMVAVNPTGKGNLQAFPVGAGKGAGLSVNYNTIDTNLANAGTVKTVTGAGPDICVASNFSSAHTVIDVLGYYYPEDGFYYTPVDPCRIADTRKTSVGIIGASTRRDFIVFGPVGGQGGNPAGCPSTLGVSPEAAHINIVAVNPTGKGNLQAFPVGAGTGAGLSVNYNTIDTNLANAGTDKTNPDISVASNFSSAHTVIDVLGYYSEEKDLLYTPVIPCRIVDTRKTSAGIIDANTQRDFRVFGLVSGQGGNPSGCSSPMDEPLAAHINMVAVNPTGKGNLQAFPVGAGSGAGLSVNYNTIDTNLANAGTVKAGIGSGPDITVASNFSSAHTVIDVLGYYYQAP